MLNFHMMNLQYDVNSLSTTLKKNFKLQMKLAAQFRELRWNYWKYWKRLVGELEGNTSNFGCFRFRSLCFAGVQTRL